MLFQSGWLNKNIYIISFNIMYLHITDMTTETQRHYPEGKILKEIFVCPLCLGKKQIDKNRRDSSNWQ